MGPIVVAGASGFVGQRLVEALRAAGRAVRCGSRDPVAAAARNPEWNWVHLDVDQPESLNAALDGASALVYLVHQMRGAHGPELLARERRAAQTVLESAERAGIRRIVYLGAPVPRGEISEHLAARQATGEVLRSGRISCIELRASMIIGLGSESWTMTRDLALRLPVMVLPSWAQTRSQPIGVDDVIRALIAALEDPLDTSAAFDLPGPEILTAREVLERIAGIRGMRAWMVPLPVLTPSVSAHWLRFVTRADYAVARQLVDGLRADLISYGWGYWDRLGTRPTPFDEVVRRTLAEDEATISSAGLRWEGWVRRLARATPVGA